MSYLIEALTLGIIYGFGPCTMFCAPVIIPLIMSSSKSSKEGIWQAFVFGLGRLTSYSILGAITGYLGYMLQGIITSAFMGIFMIALGVLVLLKKFPKKCPFIKDIKGQHTSFVSGMIIGLSPCAPLVGALSLAILSMSMINGLLIGLLFGIGTLASPVLLLGLLAGWWAKRSQKFYTMNLIVCSGFLIILGLINLLSTI